MEIQFGEGVGRGSWLIGPKLFRPKDCPTCVSSRLCDFILYFRYGHFHWHFSNMMAEIAMKKTFSWFIFCENLWTYIHLLDYRLCFQVFWLHYIYIGETSATANWQFWENQVNDWTVVLMCHKTLFLVPQDTLKVMLWVSHTFVPIWLMWPCQEVSTRRALLMWLSRLVILMEMMLEVMRGVLAMEVDKVAPPGGQISN